MSILFNVRVVVVMVLSLLLSGLVGGVAGYRSGDRAGTNAERTAWQSKEIARQVAETNAVSRRVQENTIKQAADAARNLKDEQDHEDALHIVTAERDRLRLSHAGLRISASVCDRSASAAQATADFRSADIDTGTIALPAQVTSDLFDLAAEADALMEQARAVQRRLLEDAAQANLR